MKTQTIKFPNNIYHYCKRNFVDSSLLNTKFEASQRRMGALPYDWFQKINHKEYANTTRAVDNLFREFATMKDFIDEGIDCLNKYYEDFGFTRKLSEILKRKDIKIEYENEGAYKYCHKLTVGDFKYALLTFKRDNYYKDQVERDTKNGSGTFLEPCRIFNLYKEYSHGRVAKPFMTRFVNNSEANEFDSYMLMKFIDKNPSRSKCELPVFQKDFYKYKMTDFQPGNIVNGIIVDIGRLIKNPNTPKSSEFRHNLFKFLGLIERNHEETFTTIPYRNINIEDAKKIRISINLAEEFVDDLMAEGIDIYNIDIQRFLTNIDPLERKYIITKIRRLKKAHNLKLELQQNGEYEKYQKTIEKYVKEFGSWTFKREFL